MDTRVAFIVASIALGAILPGVFEGARLEAQILPVVREMWGNQPLSSLSNLFPYATLVLLRGTAIISARTGWIALGTLATASGTCGWWMQSANAPGAILQLAMPVSLLIALGLGLVLGAMSKRPT